MTGRVFATAIVFCLLTCAGVEGGDVETALSKLEGFRPGDGHQVLRDCIGAIESEMTRGDRVIWGRLKHIIEDSSLPLVVRIEVLRVAIDKADSQIASDMLSLFAAWGNQLAMVQSDAEHSQVDTAVTARMTLVSYFIPLLSRPPWNHWIAGKEETLDLLQMLIIRNGCSLQTKQAALDALASSPAPIKTRRAYALKIITEERQWGTIPWPLLKLLDRSVFPSLRKLVRKSNDPEKFHFAAAATLSHLGDPEIVSDLEVLRPVFLQKHVNIEGMLMYYLWQIDVQNPPSKLLEYVSSTEWLILADRRMWAIRRAVELGLPKAEIRQAILTHAKQVKPTGKYGIRPGLASIKKLGLELGILRPDDLSDVKIPETKPTP